MHLRFDDKDEFGYARVLSLVGPDGSTLWTRRPSTGSVHDVWTRAEVKDQHVVAWTWEGYLVTFDTSGDVISTTFTK